ncbi:RsbT co-antagonist protein RsbRD, N-terminal domain [Acididesulfobacillus acetoxydans]|uniref:RsbT co-antagonist protein RsbRD, N-terminal domain n=1 Tax=Acididesulfobacillus acetoxydans TaxID=1561005 RepID=A0A8S0WED7_9FIRM|nr:RsbRD N-terminal domain-containing protein [Acididesulfobacillus acetoxydans]CAA7600022.1 RsbT co-antagonist protein RsbRD, N-terminal domain [Acididesulfobacillus acetoxydans]CEJ07797.1 RsbT co-antagonist protein rsbRD N-terminal domain [Acididesulfobacillus acetoxydans]
MAIESIGAILDKKSPELLKKWLDSIEGSYPAGATEVLQDEEGRFRNPAVHTIAHNAAEILTELLTGSNPNNFVKPLDGIIRLRAVQDLTPSNAVGFIFGLKEIIRSALPGDWTGESGQRELRELEDRIDALALLSFDIYESCRLQIFELRMNEMKRISGFNRPGERAEENRKSDQNQ